MSGGEEGATVTPPSGPPCAVPPAAPAPAPASVATVAAVVEEDEMVSSFKVFKKSSPNGKVTVYLGKRDFVDHISSVDPIGKWVVADAASCDPIVLLGDERQASSPC